MKKVFLLAILATVSIASFAQDTTGYHNIILNKFKKEIVDVTFKDPYSFQLLSLKYSETKVGQKLRSDIQNDSLAQGYSFLSKKDKKQKLETMNSNIEKLNSMSNEEKDSILYYFVTLECRGSNSYGNLIYSRYLGTYKPKSEKLDLMNIPK